MLTAHAVDLYRKQEPFRHYKEQDVTRSSCFWPILAALLCRNPSVACCDGGFLCRRNRDATMTCLKIAKEYSCHGDQNPDDSKVLCPAFF